MWGGKLAGGEGTSVLHPPHRGQPSHMGAFILKNSQLPLALAFFTLPGSGLWTNTTALPRPQQSRSGNVPLSRRL